MGSPPKAGFEWVRSQLFACPGLQPGVAQQPEMPAVFLRLRLLLQSSYLAAASSTRSCRRFLFFAESNADFVGAAIDLAAVVEDEHHLHGVLVVGVVPLADAHREETAVPV
jgi:hypothetical protein